MFYLLQQAEFNSLVACTRPQNCCWFFSKPRGAGMMNFLPVQTNVTTQSLLRRLVLVPIPLATVKKENSLWPIGTWHFPVVGIGSWEYENTSQKHSWIVLLILILL